MDLKFRLLNADEIEIRIAACNKAGVQLLLYKNARVDQVILDETLGINGWQKRYTRDNRNCILSLWDSDKMQWIQKEDTGTESFTEKDKGLASDAQKRAGFVAGIGRELYTAPKIFMFSNNLATFKAEGGKFKCYDTFRVVRIVYTHERTIQSVVILNENTNQVFEFKNPDLHYETIILPAPTVEPVEQENTTTDSAQAQQKKPSAPAPNNSSTKKKRTPIEGSANEALSDADIRARKKIGKPQIDNLHKMGDELIDFDKLLSICKLSSLDQMTFRIYDNILENWDKVVYECSFLF